MAESGLPAGLEMLKIDLKRDLDDFSMSNEVINPFCSVDIGIRKKLRKEDTPSCIEDEHKSCPRGLFGSGCVESTKRPITALCRCSVYVPTKFRSHDKRSTPDGNLLQVKSGSVSKRNIVQKSKLNFLRSHDRTKQSCQKLESLTQNHSAKVIKHHGCTPSIEVISEESSPRRLVDTDYVPDFQSLIPSSLKQNLKDSSNTVYDTSSFKSFQNNTVSCKRNDILHQNDKSVEDDLVNSVSRKLSVSGITSNSNASCSQEARLTANVYCDEHDISIDELASYFEDFVHIPKKMSLMAEQMYI